MSGRQSVPDRPNLPILAGTGTRPIPPTPQIRPEFKVIQDIIGGLNTSRPPDQLDDKESPDCLNVCYVNKVLCVDFGFKPMGEPVNGIPQQPIEWINPHTGTKFSLLVTTRGMYEWNHATGQWIGISGPALTSDGTIAISWCEDPAHAWLIFTNGFDVPKRFDGSTYADLPGVAGVLSTARHVVRFHGVTVFTYTTEGGTVYPYRVRRSATNDPTNWTTLDAGLDDLVDTGDAITDAIIINPYIAIIRERSVVRASYYGLGTQVFYYDYGLSTIGSIANQASTATKQMSVVVSEPGIYVYDGSYGLDDIGDKIFNTLLTYTGELNCTLALPLFLLYIPMLDETWIFYADQTMNWPGKVLRFSHKYRNWFKRLWCGGKTFAGAGLFSQSTSVRWIDLRGTRWIDRHRAWNARANQPRYHQIVLCGSDGQTYLYDFNTTVADAGWPIEWHYVSKDYPIPDEWRTVDSLVLYGKGVVDLVEVSVDYGQTYQQLGKDLVMGPFWNRAILNCSLTAAYLRVRLSGYDPSFKLSWFAFGTMTASEI